MSKTVRGRKSSQARKDNLAPILEENQTIPANEEEVKRKKNEELKKRVKMLTMGSKGSGLKKDAAFDQQSIPDTESQKSSAADNTFLTKPKVSEKKKSKAARQDDKLTAKAAMALQLLNNKEDPELALELRDEVHHLTDSRNLGQIAEDELNQTESEMRNLYRELEALEEQIKGNADLDEMDSLMKSTNDVIQYHFQTTDVLKDQLTTLNKAAEDTVSMLSFYHLDKDDLEGEDLPVNKNSKLTRENLALINEQNEEDDEADEVDPSHERSKM